MTRMLGVAQRSWCPVCRTGCGPDCPDVSRSKKAARASEKRAWRREANAGMDTLADIHMDKTRPM